MSISSRKRQKERQRHDRAVREARLKINPYSGTGKRRFEETGKSVEQTCAEKLEKISEKSQ